MAADISRLVRLQQAIDIYLEGRAELNRASLARMRIGRSHDETERSAVAFAHARLCERVEVLKRAVVDVAAGRLA
jgi:hypothetical protein